MSLFHAGCVMMPSNQYKSTDYTRVEYHDGRYWFHQADRQFLSLGVNVIIPVDLNYKTGNQPYTPGFNALAQHQGNFKSWAEETDEQLQSWGFNTLGAWCDERLEQYTPCLVTRCIWLGGYRSSEIDNRLIDVWSADYLANMENQAREQLLPHATNTQIIGFFVNNELPWYGLHGWPDDPNISLLSRYMELPAKAPGKQELIRFLREYYDNDFTKLSEEWILEASSFEELDQALLIRPKVPRHILAVADWAGCVAEQYFSEVEALMHAYAPHHLNLGVRFAGGAYTPVLEACGRHVDVVSINHYDREGLFDVARMDAIAEAVNKPILLTELSWRATENRSGCPNLQGAPVTVPTQADRAAAARRYLAPALARPYILGYHWFSWADQPPGGRFDGENSNYGLLDIYNTPYAPLVEALKDINEEAETVHTQFDMSQLNGNPQLLATYTPPILRTSETPPQYSWSGHQLQVRAWKDPNGTASLTATPSGDDLKITFTPGTGWGAGLSLQPPKTECTQVDGYTNLRGMHKLHLCISATKGLRLQVSLIESGADILGQQSYSGQNGADGEAYRSQELLTEEGRHTYTFSLVDFERNPHYGNARGNKTIDTQALRSLDLLCPTDQAGAEFTLHSWRVE